MLKKNLISLVVIVIAVALALGACAQPAPTPTPAQPPAGEAPPIKVGAILPYTGVAAYAGTSLRDGMLYALEEAGWQVAGRKIARPIEEDGSDDPAVAVSKARKLVDQDKVDVLIGPLFASQSLAVQEYVRPLQVVNINTAGTIKPENPFSFFYGNSTGAGCGYPGGLFCYDVLGARTAALMHMDYEFGYQLTEGFKQSFVQERGGKIVYEQFIPFGTADMSPYIVAMGTPDVVVGFLLTPCDTAFAKQYHEYGLKMPVFHSWIWQEEKQIAEYGDNGLGMYGVILYTPLIDTPINKEFIKKFESKFGYTPGVNVVHFYYEMKAYLEALKKTGGDTSYKKVSEALDNITFEGPAGTFTGSPERCPTIDLYVTKIIKQDGVYRWEVVKKYPKVKPL